MFSQEELKNPDTKLIVILEQKEDKEIQEAAQIESKHGVTLLSLFAKYRSEEEFIYLIGRLSPRCIETVLPKICEVVSRGSDTSQDAVRKLTCFHMILAYQSLNAISALRRRINSAAIYDALTLENKIPEAERVSWKKLLGLNNKLKEMITIENPIDKAKQKKDAAVSSPEKITISQSEVLISAFEKFIELIDNCKTLTTTTPMQLTMDGSKLILKLCMNYSDPRPEYLGWNFLHFVCVGILNENADSKALQELASRIIRNLSADDLLRHRNFRIHDEQYFGCNLLHFILLHINNMDDIQTFCDRANDDTLNKWLCERMQFKGSCHGVGFRNMTAFQMMMLYLNLPSLKAIMLRVTPKTLYLALLNDSSFRADSDNTLSCFELLEKNKNIKHGHDLKNLKQQIFGIRLFYELYDYCSILKEKRNDVVNSRIEWVKKLMNFLANPPEDYEFSNLLNQLYEDVMPADEVLVQDLPIRPFKNIMSDICSVKRVATIKEGYEACRSIFLDFFTPGVAADEGSPKRSPSPKKVKISTQDNEVFEFAKNN